jgi:LPXTG-site transpeptidase (sortase) family protein
MKKVAVYILLAYALIFSFAFYLIDKTSRSQAAVALVEPPVEAEREVVLEGERCIQGYPKRIVVPSAGVDLLIIPGSYDEASHSWNLSDDKALFANVTSLPNTKGGNTVIYGHNTWPVFKRLENLNVGDSAYLYTKEGYIFEYKLKLAKKVMPTDTQILLPRDDIRLSLLTCSGFLNEKRQLFIFAFKKLR